MAKRKKLKKTKKIKKETSYIRKMFLNDKEYEIRKAPFLVIFHIIIMGALGFIAWTLAIQIYQEKPIKIENIISFFSMISMYTINLYSINKSKSNSIRKEEVAKAAENKKLEINLKKTINKIEPIVGKLKPFATDTTNPLDKLL